MLAKEIRIVVSVYLFLKNNSKVRLEKLEWSVTFVLPIFF
jgi:hypothetical protein